MAKEARCDYCGKGLECDVGSVLDREYWCIPEAVRACDECMLANATDFVSAPPDQRLFALRMLYGHHSINLDKVEAAIGRARGVIDDRQVSELEGELSRARQLHHDGYRLAAVEAGATVASRAMTFVAGMVLVPPARVGARAQKQRSDAGFSSGRERAVEDVAPKLQAEYDRLHAEQKYLSHTRVSDLVGAKFNCSGRNVRNHVTRFK